MFTIGNTLFLNVETDIVTGLYGVFMLLTPGKNKFIKNTQII